MAQRKPLSKKTRFEVFKRDSFTCQYCGATPPSVVLHVDHINPVANGGGNHIDNLITSCDHCNLGKGATVLSDIPQSLKDRAKEVAEREEQIAGYNKILMERQHRIEDEAWEVVFALEHDKVVESYNRKRLQSIKMFLQKLPFAHVLDAASITASKFRIISEGGFRYFCGVCWAMIREQGNA